MKTVEIRVRPVTRYIVTAFEGGPRVNDGASVGSSVLGEYPSAAMADCTAMIFKAAHPIARVVTSDGTVHDPVEVEWIITKVKTFDVANEVYFAGSEAEAIKTRDSQEEATGTEWACFSRPKASRRI